VEGGLHTTGYCCWYRVLSDDLDRRVEVGLLMFGIPDSLSRGRRGVTDLV